MTRILAVIVGAVAGLWLLHRAMWGDPAPETSWRDWAPGVDYV